MAHRRRRAEPSDRPAPSNVDQLTFKYMMCKVESSTDSESEISPRWSDTSTMGCVSSAPESRTSQRALPVTHKPAERHGCHSSFLDPYDGSSEDSDEARIDVGVSSKQTRRPGKGGGAGGCRLSGRSRRLHHPVSVKDRVKDSVMEEQHLSDVQMKCGSDSELWMCERDPLPSHSGRDGCRNLTEGRVNDSTTHTQTMDTELQLDDSGLHTRGSFTSHTPAPQTSVEGSSSQMLDSSSERSPGSGNLRSLCKRKLALPGAGAMELGQRKKQCVINMEDEQDGNDSAVEQC